MSRSYKKFPFCKDRDSGKWGKKYCNKRLRKMTDVPNGSQYQKFTNRWDYIYDYWDSNTWEEWKTWRAKWGDDVDTLDYYEWYRIYKGK